MLKTIYLLTGSNIGNSQMHLQLALVKIASVVGHITKQSSVYKTEPWGNTNQQDFLNQVLEVETELHPIEVLKIILTIETEMGRNRMHKWEPRIIDIDLLFYADEIIESDELVVPHPLLHQRRFTLLPLAEIAANVVHPIFIKTIGELLVDCTDTSLVEKM
jgi:2-amino-4-hydroxy-6-hydroxymethyldihydropteridine diphosphokinase